MSDADVTRPKGQRLLVAWMSEEPERRTQVWIAKTLGIKQPSVSAWVNGTSRPDLGMRVALRILAGDQNGKPRIPEESWETAPERKRRLAALRSIERSRGAA